MQTSEALLRAWVDARSVEELARAEEDLLAVSTGPITSEWTVGLGPVPVVPTAADPVGAEAEWLSRAIVPKGGTRCPSLFGAIGSEARAERIAHIPVGIRLPHPALPAQVRMIPVVPPALRPPIVGDGVYGTPAADVLYAQIALWLRLLGSNPERAVEELLEQVTVPLQALIAAGPRGPWSRWVPNDPPWAPAPLIPPTDTLRVFPSALVFHQHHLAFDNGQVTVFDLDAEAVVQRFATRGAELVGMDDRRLLLVADGPTGERIRLREEATTARVEALTRAGIPFDAAAAEAYYAHLPEETDDQAPRFYAMDRSDGRWTELPSDVPRVRFVEVLERSVLVRDDGARSLLSEVSDYATTQVFTPDRRFVWVEDKHGNGGVFRTADSCRVAELPAVRELPPGTPYFDGSSIQPVPVDTPDEDEDEDEDAESPPWEALHTDPPYAVARAPDGGFVTFRGGLVTRGGRPILRMAVPVELAAIRGDGQYLATLGVTEWGERVLRIFELGDPPTLVSRRTVA